MEITVNLSQRSYPVIIDQGSTNSLSSIVTDTFGKRRFVIVTNTTIASLYKSKIDSWIKELDCSMYAIPDGEQYKTIDTWKGILDFLLENRFERSSVLIALGGGVVGDIAGFAAASFLRGISYIQVPTTLLAMVDSSIGGKTAVDHPMGKNLIGAFHQPSMTLVDTDFLKTLPPREFLCGYAELFKYAFIGGPDTFNFISEENERMLQHNPESLLDGIRRSIEIKSEIVSEDEFETKGLRALLNFGHTFAHSIERFFNFEKVLHGEAVIWGIRCACALGERIGTVPQESTSLYRNMLERLPVPALPSLPEPSKLYSYMFSDKKVSSGKLNFVIPVTPGTSIVKKDIEQKDIIAVLEEVFRGQQAV
ncbi:MAG TPA: 3-dehydroquinate synthase [Chitinispirillaceae bacterium]|nr:3-dehydroquinate synthase [Chitinispirillaceae bacterium]